MAEFPAKLGTWCEDLYSELFIAFLHGTRIFESEYAKLTESPIELKFLLATEFMFRLLGWNLEICTSDLKFTPQYGENLIFPQYVWGRYRSDFCFRSWNCGKSFLIECDGYDFHSTKEQIEKDGIRDREACSNGYVIIRLPGSTIHKDPIGCVNHLIDAVTTMAQQEKRAA